MDKLQTEDQRKVWGEIAEGWTNWRQHPVKEVQALAAEWKQGKLLDIGCGNGRNILPFAKAGFGCHGLDFSAKMIELAQGLFKRSGLEARFKVAHAAKLPFRSGEFDYCLNIAMFHHIKGEKERKKALAEMCRVLKHKGKALITVWNKYSAAHWRLAFKPKETLIPWSRKGQVYQRYYYLFNYWEMKKLVEASGFRILKAGGIFEKNIVFIIGKI